MPDVKGHPVRLPDDFDGLREWDHVKDEIGRSHMVMHLTEKQLNEFVAGQLGGTVPIVVPDYCHNMAHAWLAFQHLVVDTGDAAITMNMEDYGREPGDIGTVTAGGWSITKRVPRAICELLFIVSPPTPHVA